MSYTTSVLRKRREKFCTGAIILKGYNMKKTYITIFLILIIASAGIFAATDDFTVTTTVAEIGLMKVSEAAILASTNQAFIDSGDFTTLPITTHGPQTFEAYMTVLANKRTGFNVSMKATAMVSTEGGIPSYIRYTVACGSGTTTTPAGTGFSTLTVLGVTSLTALTGFSRQISVSIDETTFNAAVAGSYVGTVTFEFTSN